MKSQIVEASREDLLGLVRDHVCDKDFVAYQHFAGLSSKMWLGFIDGHLICAWALIPSTLISRHAYLWLHVTDALVGNEFVFIRKSKIAVDQMLKEYPKIIGHVQIGNDKAIRWLKWLGATLGEPMDQKMIPFTIRKANGRT